MIINHNLKIYPWQNQAWQQLHAYKAKMPHAILLHGPAGIGKYDFARYLSQTLLCTQQDKTAACGLCASCHWFNEGSHPDFKLISPEEDETENTLEAVKKSKKKTQISVAQIRDLTDFVGLSSHHQGGLRIILIHPAEALNNASANALLKMLEEPAAGVLFLLVTHQLQRLLPTIISRCQKINMPIPNQAQSLAWLDEQGVSNAQHALHYFGGSPIKVMTESLQLSNANKLLQLLAQGDKLQAHSAAPALIADSVEAGIVALQKWLYDLVSVKYTREVRYHIADTHVLRTLAEKANLGKLLQLQKNLNELRKLALHPLNHELQIERLLVEYTHVFSKSAAN